MFKGFGLRDLGLEGLVIGGQACSEFWDLGLEGLEVWFFLCEGLRPFGFRARHLDFDPFLGCRIQVDPLIFLDLRKVLEKLQPPGFGFGVYSPP